MYNAFRHSLGCQLLDQGEDIDLVRQQLGHSKIEMTMRYGHPVPENKRKAVAVLKSVFKKKVVINRSYEEELIEAKKPLSG